MEAVVEEEQDHEHQSSSAGPHAPSAPALEEDDADLEAGLDATLGEIASDPPPEEPPAGDIAGEPPPEATDTLPSVFGASMVPAQQMKGRKVIFDMTDYVVQAVEH